LTKSPEPLRYTLRPSESRSAVGAYPAETELRVAFFAGRAALFAEADFLFVGRPPLIAGASAFGCMGRKASPVPGAAPDVGLRFERGLEAVLAPGLDAVFVLDPGLDAVLVLDPGLDPSLVFDPGLDPGLVLDPGLDAVLVLDPGLDPILDAGLDFVLGGRDAPGAATRLGFFEEAMRAVLYYGEEIVKITLGARGVRRSAPK
jgi:hypothetical protein